MASLRREGVQPWLQAGRCLLCAQAGLDSAVCSGNQHRQRALCNLAGRRRRAGSHFWLSRPRMDASGPATGEEPALTRKVTHMAPVSVVVIGAGDRGTGYARWALRHPDRASVVAVAEPREVRRAQFAAEHGIAARNVAVDWRQLAGRGRLADAVLICTQDRMHAGPAEAFAALGYHILLEKPMAPDEAGCRRIVAAVEKAGVMLAVGHVMRYMPYTRAVKEIVDSGQLGDIMSVQHLEPVGFWHQAHSYVRGNWRRADLAASMLMAKSCHDLDWLVHILGRVPARVASFGHLTHFTAANRPAGAADRCVACPVEAGLPVLGAAAVPGPAGGG